MRSPFSSLRPPRAPAELRGRVLAACREAAAEVAEPLLDRLWRSRPLRRAWLVTVAALAMANLAVLPASPDRGAIRSSAGVAQSRLSEELGLQRWWWASGGPTTWSDLGPAGDWPGLELD